MLAKSVSSALAEGALAMVEDELAEPFCRGQPERLQPRWSLPTRIGEPAGGHAGWRDDPHQSASLAQRQQSSRSRLHQLIVIKRAGSARNSIEPLVGGAERARQRRKIGLLANGVGASKHAICADAYRSCAMRGGGQDPTRQQVADTIEFRIVARSARNELGTVEVRQDRRRRDVGGPISRSGAANGRASNATDRHRCPRRIVRLDFSASPR